MEFNLTEYKNGSYLHSSVYYIKTDLLGAGFEVLTAVVRKSTVFWHITPCSPLKVNRRLGGIYRLHLQGPRISRARNKHESRWQAVGFLLGLFLNPEDEGDMFLRKVC
jgi:hypothetical protein